MTANQNANARAAADVCLDDSGAPMLYGTGDKQVAVGVMSSGDAVCRALVAGVRLDDPGVLAWLHESRHAPA